MIIKNIKKIEKVLKDDTLKFFREVIQAVDSEKARKAGLKDNK